LKKLAIKDLAEQTGVAAGTIRMWEQRYGFPEPARTPAGYRVYTEQDVVALRRVVAYRGRGLSVPAALERARSLDGETDSPSIFAALASGDAPVRPQKLRRATLIALSRAIEEEAMARAAGPVVIGAFQDEANYRAVEHRYRRLAHVADAVGVFATFEDVHLGHDDEPAEIPITTAEALGHEWAVIVDAPGYAACLVGWETPGRGDERIFEAVWTMDAPVVRRAAQVGATIAARHAPEWSERLLSILADRPLAVEAPAPGLTALTNRMIGYLDAAAGSGGGSLPVT
jgi:MerR family transcriptional regulator, light-induced transcriptional regulator